MYAIIRMTKKYSYFCDRTGRQQGYEIIQFLGEGDVGGKLFFPVLFAAKLISVGCQLTLVKCGIALWISTMLLWLTRTEDQAQHFSVLRLGLRIKICLLSHHLELAGCFRHTEL